MESWLRKKPTNVSAFTAIYLWRIVNWFLGGKKKDPISLFNDLVSKLRNVWSQGAVIKIHEIDWLRSKSQLMSAKQR